MEHNKQHFISDEVFDALFPAYIQKLSVKHWTPIAIALKAGAFLGGSPESRVVDIGAGIGKFCITAKAHFDGYFTGIEQRANFVKIGNRVIKKLGLKQVELLQGNFTEVDFTSYTGIYFYNSFHENIVIADSLDKKIERSEQLYKIYVECLEEKLIGMPIGMKLATYYMYESEMPDCYTLIETHFDRLLLFWIKTA